MRQSLFYLFIFAMIAMTLVVCDANGQNESQRIYQAINSQREQMKLPPLIYRIGEQLTVEERVQQISFHFALADDCECDYESIAGDNSLQALVSKMTNIRKYDWLHFDREARFATVAVVEREGIYYCVVRTYVN